MGAPGRLSRSRHFEISKSIKPELLKVDCILRMPLCAHIYTGWGVQGVKCEVRRLHFKVISEESWWWQTLLRMIRKSFIKYIGIQPGVSVAYWMTSNRHLTGSYRLWLKISPLGLPNKSSRSNSGLYLFVFKAGHWHRPQKPRLGLAIKHCCREIHLSAWRRSIGRWDVSHRSITLRRYPSHCYHFNQWTLVCYFIEWEIYLRMCPQRTRLLYCLVLAYHMPRYNHCVSLW